jgi:hypothetical protein
MYLVITIYTTFSSKMMLTYIARNYRHMVLGVHLDQWQSVTISEVLTIF